MRTSLTPLLLSFSLVGLSQIPNGGFETWSTMGSYEDPDGWTTVNALTVPMLGCEEGSPAPEGNSYARITTLNTEGVGLLPGVIYAGASAHLGFPYAQRPDALTGQWQFLMQGGDVGYITVGFNRWNPDIQFPEPVGVGYTFMSGAMPVWQPFSIPITWVSAEVPDTATIQIYTSYGTATDGSTLSIDDLAFDLTEGVNSHPADDRHGLRTSFVAGELHIQASEPLMEVVVLDLGGRELMRRMPNANAARLDLQDLSAGLFILRARFTHGSASHVFVKD